jgi:glutamine amidotransferase
MIAIIDYGMGNLRSVEKAVERVGGIAEVTNHVDIIQSADKIIVPGVGAMQPAMDKLVYLGLVTVIKGAATLGKPILGICLGMQLLFETSDEGGQVDGFGLIEGTVKKFMSLKVPHMGWNQLEVKPAGQAMFAGMADKSDAYFCHSFYCAPKDPAVIAASTEYGTAFASAVCKNNVWGVQFHPEKSQSVGLKILENFVKVPS